MRVLGLAWAFVRRDFATARSYRFPFLLQLVGSAGILLVVYQVSRLVDPGLSDDPTLRTGYFPFVLVGMAVVAVVHSALQSFGAKLRDEQVTGTFEALCTTPSPPAVLALCLAAYDLVQALVSAVLLLAAGTVLGARYATAPVAVAATLVALVAVIAVAAAVGVAVAAFTVVFKRGSTVAGLAAAVVALLAGVYFPVGQLPAVVRWAAEALPFTWGITSLRTSLLLGEVDVVHLVGVVLAAAALLPAALVLFSRAVDRARRQGSLAQY